MGVAEILDKIKERKREKKELIRRMDEQLRAEELLSERRKSANERELDKFMKEDREEFIKKQLEKARKLRDEDIRFGHNPLDVKNITNHTDWQVLREKNMFGKKSNMFSGQEFIHKNNPKLLKNERWLMK